MQIAWAKQTGVRFDRYGLSILQQAPIGHSIPILLQSKRCFTTWWHKLVDAMLGIQQQPLSRPVLTRCCQHPRTLRRCNGEQQRECLGARKLWTKQTSLLFFCRRATTSAHHCLSHLCIAMLHLQALKLVSSCESALTGMCTGRQNLHCDAQAAT